MNVENFKDLHYQTKLLESLGWDETQLETLFEYLDTVLTADIVQHPNKIENDIGEFFGEETKICFAEILKEVMINHNLHLIGNKDEH